MDSYEEIQIAKETEKRGEIRVLIVEDDRMVADLLGEWFEEAGGFKIERLTDNTDEALAILRKFKEEGKPMQLVFSDLGLKGNNEGGYVIADAVREENLARYFILYTSRANIVRETYPTPDKLKEKGIDSLIDKPVSVKTLMEGLSKVKTILNSPPTPNK